MGNLAEIVNLGTAVDDGGAHGGAVDAGVGTNLHIVLDDHIAYLVNLVVGAVARGGKAEAVGTHHHAGMEDAPVANGALAVNLYARIQDSVVAHMAVVAHIHLRVNLHVVADDGVAPYHGEGTDIAALAYASRAMDAAAQRAAPLGLVG